MRFASDVVLDRYAKVFRSRDGRERESVPVKAHGCASDDVFKYLARDAGQRYRSVVDGVVMLAFLENG